GQAERGTHHLRRCGPPCPQLEACGSLGGEHLETVEHAHAGGCRGLGRRGARIREIDQRLPTPELEQHLVSHRRRLDHEVGVLHLRRPLAAPGEDTRRRQRVTKRRRRPPVSHDGHLVTVCYLLEDRRVRRITVPAHDG